MSKPHLHVKPAKSFKKKSCKGISNIVLRLKVMTNKCLFAHLKEHFPILESKCYV